MEEKTMSDYWRERAKEEERYHKSIRWRYVMTVDHPMGHCAEVLFSNDGENYKSLDGLTPSYFEDMGFVTASVAHYPLDSVIPYQIMANALEEKMAMLKLHCKYKEENCAELRLARLGLNSNSPKWSHIWQTLTTRRLSSSLVVVESSK